MVAAIAARRRRPRPSPPAHCARCARRAAARVITPLAAVRSAQREACVVPSAASRSRARQSAPSLRPKVWTRHWAWPASDGRIRAVGAEQQQAAPRHQPHQPRERQPHRVEIGVDVGVIEFDVVDDGDVGQVLEELRGLVEVGAVVLVALDDERAPGAEAVAGAAVAEVPGDAADQHRRVEPAVVSSQAAIAVVVVLPCVPAIDDRLGVPQELVADRLGQRGVAQRAVEHRLQLRDCRARWRCRRRPGRCRSRGAPARSRRTR